MKYIKSAVFGVLFAVLFSITSAFAASSSVPAALTGHDLGQWSLSLSGNGAVTTATPSKFRGGANLELGHTGDLILPLEFGVRQGVGYGNTSPDRSSNWNFTTSVFNDWRLVKLGNFEVDAGVNGAVTYGNTPLAWSVAPEAVGRLWLLKNVNTFLRGEYPFKIGRAHV